MKYSQPATEKFQGALPRHGFGEVPIISHEVASKIALMNHRSFLKFVAGISLCLAARFAQAQNNPISIMPMGDSVTARGSFPESSYRYWLWLDLTNAGFNVQFVGQNSGVSDGAPANSWPDEEYEGGPLGGIPDGDGWTTTDGILDAPNAASLTPQILLLDLGANDIIAGTSLDQIQTNLETIVDTFAANDPGVIVILAVPTGFAADPSSTRQVQRQQRADQSKMAGVVNRVVRTERKAGVDIEGVNLFSGYNVHKDTVDLTHPNIQGEQQIARKYFKKLRPIIKKMIKEGA